MYWRSSQMSGSQDLSRLRKNFFGCREQTTQALFARMCRRSFATTRNANVPSLRQRIFRAGSPHAKILFTAMLLRTPTEKSVLTSRPIATRPSRRKSRMWLLNFLNCRKPKSVCATHTTTAAATKYPGMSVTSLVEHDFGCLFVGYQHVNRLTFARAHNRGNFFAGRRHTD